MPIHLLDKAYRIASPNGVSAYRVVVHGPLVGECSLPAAENAGNLAGVTVHDQTTPGRSVTVRKAGIAEVAAAGPIPLGAPVIAAGTSGKVKAASGAAGTRVNVLGFAESVAVQDGDIIEVFISIHERTL
jgi:hypothetical protein